MMASAYLESPCHSYSSRPLNGMENCQQKSISSDCLNVLKVRDLIDIDADDLRI